MAFDPREFRQPPPAVNQQRPFKRRRTAIGDA